METTKTAFLNALRDELIKRGINDNEITEDFEQHFAIGISEGLTEAQVCEKLGNPAEIAQQYTSGTDASADGFANGNHGYAGETAEVSASAQETTQSGGNFNGGKIAGVICLDVFVLVWAVPVLFALIIAYWAVMISVGVAGAVLIAGVPFTSMFSFVVIASAFTPIVNIFAGIALIGIAVIMAAFCISVWKGAFGVLKSIGRLHMSAFSSN